MTLIAQAQGLVLADSCRGVATGYEYSPGKIVAYNKPHPMRSARLKFKDWFFGYAGTGDEEVIKYAGELALAGQLDLLEDRYKYVDEMRFLNDYTTFSIMLFGLNGTALLECQSGKVVLSYHEHHATAQVSVGSGARAFNRLFKEGDHTICPVRTMYGTFTMEPSCGGAVEVWRLPLAVRGKNKGFVKLGEFPHKNLLECFQMMSTPNKFHFKEDSREWLKSVIHRLAKRSPNTLAGLMSDKSLRRWASPPSKSVPPKTEATSPASKKSAPSPETSS